MFKFYMRYVLRDNTCRYRTTPWNDATPATVFANDRAGAMEKLENILGPAPRYQKWAIRVDGVEEAEEAYGKCLGDVLGVLHRLRETGMVFKK